MYGNEIARGWKNCHWTERWVFPTIEKTVSFLSFCAADDCSRPDTDFLCLAEG